MPALNTKYRAVSTGQEFVLDRIVDRHGGKKLTNPIYHFQYTNRETGGFTCFLKDIERSLSFGAWVETDEVVNEGLTQDKLGNFNFLNK